MINVYCGLPGSGKTTKMADITLYLLKRNKKYYKKTGKIRKVCSNMLYSEELHKKYDKFIQYWSDIDQIIKFRDCDVIIDEIATYLDATQWQNTSLEVKRFFQQHRKYGIDIYGTTQDFPMIDISMRRLVSNAYMCRKMIGSRDKSATRPEVKNIWGLIMIRQFDPQKFKEDGTYNYDFLPSFLVLDRQLVDIFDTTQEILSRNFPPLKHIMRVCEDPNCNHVKILHV